MFDSSNKPTTAINNSSTLHSSQLNYKQYMPLRLFADVPVAMMNIIEREKHTIKHTPILIVLEKSNLEETHIKEKSYGSW